MGSHAFDAGFQGNIASAPPPTHAPAFDAAVQAGGIADENIDVNVDSNSDIDHQYTIVNNNTNALFIGNTAMTE